MGLTRVYSTLAYIIAGVLTLRTTLKQLAASVSKSAETVAL